jgi:hypothetical protein
MTDVNNISMISAKTLTMLMTEVPLSKAQRFLKLLIDDDLASFRDYVEKKLATNENFIKSAEASPNAEDNSQGEGAYKVNLSSVKNECLVIFEIMAKIDKTLQAREEAEEKAARKKDEKKHKKLLNILQEQKGY